VTRGYDGRTALLVVDVQNDFADPAGSLHVPDGEAVVEAVNEEIERALEGGALVTYTQDWHPPATPHFAKDGGIWPVHCVAGSWGAELVSTLHVAGPVVRKGTAGEDGYSAFTVRDPSSGEERPTELAAMLRERAVTRVVIVGLATDYCVKATALDAVGHGYETVVVPSAVRAVDRQPGDGDWALDELAAAGVALG
jgi:nicotinamidase/pyrazinamidase